MDAAVNLLMVEDNDTDAELIRMALEAGGFNLDWRRVDSEEDLRGALADRPWDLIISDFAMPGFSGLRAFEIYRAMDLDVPFVFVSGALGEERAVEAMRAGAKDYIVKGNLARLSAVVRRELLATTDRRAQRAAEEHIARQQERLALAMDATQAGVFEIDLRAGGSVEFSGAWDRILGSSEHLPRQGPNLIEAIWDLAHPEDRERLRAGLRFGRDGRCTGTGRLRNQRGDWVEVSVFAHVVEWGMDGRLARLAGVVIDRSREGQLEAQLRQAQKMEAVGQLAGEVAHDFNNLLTAILSFSTFALEGLPADSHRGKDIQEAIRAAQRAQSLTAQLLAFSRRKAVTPRVLNANQIIEGTERMLGRLLGADVELSTAMAPDLWNVWIDSDAVEQVLLNLAVNARDAMPRGGQLMIRTANATIVEDDEGMQEGAVPPGAYATFSVSDTGTGMDPSIQARIFEPFFTTKEAGKGTGLGLSTCYGIVKQANGHIAVDSEMGVGTTFTIYLPRAQEPLDSAAPAPEPDNLLGRETVLVAEDDAQIRALVVRILKAHGYQVLAAADGAEALRLFDASNNPVDLLITDLVMPLVGGQQLVETLRGRARAPRVLFMSGYAAEAIGKASSGEQGRHVLQKPFTPVSLATKVRQILDG